MKKIKIAKNLALLITIAFFLNIGVLGSTNGEMQTNTIIADTINDIDKSNWDYTDLELISVGMTMTSDVPDMVIDSQGNIHIVWLDYSNWLGSGTDGAIFYRYFDVTTETWSGIYYISDETGSGIVNFEPAIAIDSEDNLYVVWESYSDYGGSGSDYDLFFRMRNSSSQLWQTTEVVSTESTSSSFHPDIIVAQNGDVSVVWTDTTDYLGCGTDSDLFFKQRIQATDSWTTTQVVSTVSSSGSDDACLDIDSNGKIHVVWEDITDYDGAGPDYDLFYSIYDPSGDSWSTTELLTYFSGEPSRRCSIRMDNEDNIHLCWEEMEDIQGSTDLDVDIAYMCYINSIGTWGTVDIVSIESSGNTYATETQGLEVDSEGNVHFVWYDNEYGNSTYNVAYRTLYTDINVWSKVELISMESTDSLDFSLEPVIAIDKADNIYFAWSEGKDNILSSGNDYDIVFRAYGGPPQAPYLEEIAPNPTDSSSIILRWNSVPGAVTYKIYRDNSFIYEIDGSSIELVSTIYTNYFDTLSAEGVYYYIVVAENRFGVSAISNCVLVDYKLPTLTEEFIGFALLAITMAIAIPIVFKKKKKKREN